MKKTSLIILSLFFVALSCTARSFVLTLNDTAGTRVFFKVDRKTHFITPIGADGIITLCGRNYQLMNLKQMSISSTDYSGESGTEDGTATTAVAQISEDGLTMSGQKQVFDACGRLVKTVSEGNVNLDELPQGVYVITNGVSTIKVSKQ